jgi:hypothetical protein
MVLSVCLPVAFLLRFYNIPESVNATVTLDTIFAFDTTVAFIFLSATQLT